jgi:hypothetical protein
MLRKNKIALITIILVLALAPVAFAGLSAVSPVFNDVATSNGFPQWYTDANGVTVDLPVPPAGNGTAAPTMIYGPLTQASSAYAQQAGFDTEAFYFNARPDPKTYQTAYGKIVVVFGLEASYSTGIPTPGDQVVFARIRIKAPLKVAGTYTFSHPWGTESIVVTAADINANKGIFFTKDVGLTPGWVSDGGTGWTPVAAPLGFYGVLQPGNTMSTFLRAVSPAPPAGWIGDGVTPTTVTGSPIGYNKVRLEGPDPNLDGKNHNFVETTLFVVSGHIPASTAVPLPLSVDRATCSYIGTVEHLDVWLTSKQGAIVTITDVVTGTPLSGYPTTVDNASGKYFASFPGTTKSINVAVSTTAPGFTAANKTVPVLDYVNITSTAYSLTVNPNTLTVKATSSDFFTAAKQGRLAPTLTVTGFGKMTVDAAGVYTLGPIAVTTPLPPTIAVTSTTGGSDTSPVGIVP